MAEGEVEYLAAPRRFVLCERAGESSRHDHFCQRKGWRPATKDKQQAALLHLCSGGVRAPRSSGWSFCIRRFWAAQQRHWFCKKLAAPEGVPERSPNSVLTGPCNG